MTLQRRLLQLLLIGAPLTWAIALGVALYTAGHEINELFDTQQVRLAQQVMALAGAARFGAVRETVAPSGTLGEAELDDVAVAVWDAQGRALVADADGTAIPFDANARGFVDTDLKGKPWRLYYLAEGNGGVRVAVGQAAEERRDVLLGLLGGQLLPWVLMLPVLLAVLAAAVRRGLRPVRDIAAELQARRADSLAPLTSEVPAELKPLVDAMNDLFARIERALENERRLTADAAHELRTPLAALRAQWEAAQLAPNDAARAHAQRQIGAGLERLTRLVTQLLALAGLDSRGAKAFTQQVRWPSVVEQALSDCLPLLERTGSDVEAHWPDDPAAALPLVGDEALLALLLRNLIDNALRYGPSGARVQLRFTPTEVSVEDEGPGLSREERAQLGRRFFRRPGQAQAGSGLGVSIARRVAELHGLQLRFEDRTVEGSAARGLRVVLSYRGDPVAASEARRTAAAGVAPREHAASVSQ
jgi:two-component system sensor histidine kinase QseC